MGNCLVIKLKCEVNNPELITMNDLKVTKASAEMVIHYLLSNNKSVINLRTTGDCYIYNAAGTAYFNNIDHCQEAELSRNFMEFALSGIGSVIIPDKNKLTHIELKSLKIDNINDLLYFDDYADYIGLSNCVITKGNVAVLNKYSRLKKLQFGGATTEAYDIDVFASLYRLEELLLGEQATGDIESFVVTQAAGRTSGTASTISLGYTQSSITINGQKASTAVGTSYRLILNFDGSGNCSITYNNVVKATYNNGSWTYNL